MVISKDIDWEGNCEFKNGKVVGFKVDKQTNHYHMRPIPCEEKFINEAKQASITLDAIMKPATREQVAIAWKKLSLHCGVQGKSTSEINSLVADYYHDLKEYPIRLIEEACETYRKLPKDNNFMPTTGKLISLMSEKHYKMKFLRTRIDKILGLYIEPAWEQNKMLSLNDILAKLL